MLKQPSHSHQVSSVQVCKDMVCGCEDLLIASGALCSTSQCEVRTLSKPKSELSFPIVQHFKITEYLMTLFQVAFSLGGGGGGGSSSTGCYLPPHEHIFMEH